jgi:hypothetical protein
VTLTIQFLPAQGKSTYFPNVTHYNWQLFIIIDTVFTMFNVRLDNLTVLSMLTTTGVVDTGGNLTTGVVDTGGNFVTGVIDTVDTL